MVDKIDAIYLLNIAIGICGMNIIALAWIIKSISNDIDKLNERITEVENKIDKTN